MFERLFSSESACRRHRCAPFADERERYLRHCAEQGATRATLRMKAKELLWLARHLGSGAAAGVDIEDLRGIARQRQSVCRGRTTAPRLIDIARPWLKFLGWWRAPVVARALEIGAMNYRSVVSILSNNLDRVASRQSHAEPTLFDHPNVRGPRYFN
jgi:hypothetical protein